RRARDLHRTAPRKDLAAQVLAADRERDVVLVRLSLVEQRESVLGPPREPGRVRGGVKQARRPRRQRRRPLVGGGRDGVGAAVIRARAGLRERGRRGIVRPDRREREVPRPAVRVTVWQRMRQRAMRRAALLGGGGAVDGGA